MTTKESLAVAVSELIKRMSPKERIELMRHISWEELEEWKATQEALSDRELMRNLKKGLKDDNEGKVGSPRFPKGIATGPQGAFCGRASSGGVA